MVLSVRHGVDTEEDEARIESLDERALSPLYRPMSPSITLPMNFQS
jgi:hypothetical protein